MKRLCEKAMHGDETRRLSRGDVQCVTDLLGIQAQQISRRRGCAEPASHPHHVPAALVLPSTEAMRHSRRDFRSENVSSHKLATRKLMKFRERPGDHGGRRGKCIIEI